MTGSQVAAVIITVAGVSTILLIAARAGHYIRTGRWFR
jgi:hypothetical protein